MILFKITVPSMPRSLNLFQLFPYSHQQHAVTSKGELSVFQPKQIPSTVSLAKPYQYNGTKQIKCTQKFVIDTIIMIMIYIYTLSIYILRC